MSDTRRDQHTSGRAQSALLFCACAAIGSLTGVLLWPEPQAQAAGSTELRVLQMAAPPGVDAELLALRLAQHYLAETVTVVGPAEPGTDGARLEWKLSRAELGARVDINHLTALLQQARDPMSALRRLHQRVGTGLPLTLPMTASLDAEVARPRLTELKDRVDRPAIDAQVDPRKKQLVAAAPGLALDIEGSLDRIEQALIDGDDRIELAHLSLAPARTIERFEDIDLSAVVGEFSTRHSRGKNAKDRTHNLRVAARKIDGHVVQPGEVFDFNAVVGDRTRSNGFRPAPVIAEGELAEGMGGGTCQIASTLHAAVFFAGLPVLTRHPHSRPSFYIKLGLDAAVAYGSLNFRFKNDRPYPLVLDMTVADGVVHAAIHGPRRQHEVSLLRNIDETTPFEEKVVEDESLPRGLRVLQQRGVPGFVVTRVRVVRDVGNHLAVRETGQDRYPPTTQIWRVGSGPEAGPDFELPENDPHPEYVADEYMMATQGPGIDGIEVSAKAGRTGTYGWTEREGLGPSTETAAN
ncbi:MAG: VanW family protein [Myxococcales bacterium]|nr:VanW family protein [Myxococcales bacterium]